MLWLFFQAFIGWREKLRQLFLKHRTNWEICPDWDIISLRKLATWDTWYSKGVMSGLDFDPRSKGHGQLFNFSGPLLFSDFQSKGVKWGNLQILCTKVPGHTHWKTNTPEFVPSTTLASVKRVRVTHMLSGREDRMWGIRWDDRRQELSGCGVGVGGRGQWLVQRCGSSRGNQDMSELLAVSFPSSASLPLCLHPQFPCSHPVFGTILPITSLSPPAKVKPTGTCSVWISHFFRVQLQIHYNQKWCLKYLTTNQNDASCHAEVRFWGRLRRKFECFSFWIVGRPRGSQWRGRTAAKAGSPAKREHTDSVRTDSSYKQSVCPSWRVPT